MDHPRRMNELYPMGSMRARVDGSCRSRGSRQSGTNRDLEKRHSGHRRLVTALFGRCQTAMTEHATDSPAQAGYGRMTRSNVDNSVSQVKLSKRLRSRWSTSSKQCDDLGRDALGIGHAQDPRLFGEPRHLHSVLGRLPDLLSC